MAFTKRMNSRWISRTPAFRQLVSAGAITTLIACSGPPLTTHSISPSLSSTVGMPSALVSSESQTLTSGIGDDDIPQYSLGPSDVISISIYRHPELSIPRAGGSAISGGVMITNDGTVDLTLVGNVALGGLTVEEAQNLLEHEYSKYIRDADVAVQLVSPKSLRYYLLGDFSQPGAKFPERQLPLLDALSLGGGIDVTNADLYQAYVAVGRHKLPVDLHALLVDGDMSQNIILDPGATIVIPPAADEKAFVFGSVGKPGAIGFEGGSLSLIQAISEAGMDLANYTSAELSQVRIIRSHGAGADFIVVDAEKIVQGNATDFAMQPGDIVFVPPDGVATWNQALSMLLPSLSAVSGLLNPFVSIKYLSQRNN